MAIKGRYSISREDAISNPGSFINSQIRNLFERELKSRGEDESTIDLFQRGTQVLDLASEFEDLARKQVTSVLGREPSRTELFGFLDNTFDRLKEGVIRGKKGSPFLSGGDLKNAFQRELSGSLEGTQGQLNIINRANLDLQSLGVQLPPDITQDILLGKLGAEEAERTIETFKKSVIEGKLQQELAGLPAQEEAAISELEKSLTSQQQQFFEQDLAPTIISQLNVRGLLDSGSLATALAKTGGQLQREIRNVIAPLRAQVGLGAPQRAFEQTLRGALEAGQSLREATQFARNLIGLQREQGFTASQSQLARQFQSELFRQRAGLELALRPKGPSALDLFLQHGLPVVGGLAQSAILAKGK